MEKELKDHFFKEREKGSEEKKKEPKQRTKKMVIPTIFAVATLRNLNNCFEHKSKMFWQRSEKPGNFSGWPGERVSDQNPDQKEDEAGDDHCSEPMPQHPHILSTI